MTNDDPSSVPRQVALWTEFLGPPVLWLIQFQVRYSLVPWCCAHGNESLLWLLSGVSLALAAVLVLMSWVSWKRTIPSEFAQEATVGQRRARFMAMMGLMTSTLFFLVIATQAIPVFFVNPCIQ